MPAKHLLVRRRKITDDERAAIEDAYRAGEDAALIAARFDRHKSVIFTIGEQAGIHRGKPHAKSLDGPERLPWYQHPPLPHPLARVLVQVGAPCWRCGGKGTIELNTRCPLCWGRGTQR